MKTFSQIPNDGFVETKEVQFSSLTSNASTDVNSLTTANKL